MKKYFIGFIVGIIFSSLIVSASLLYKADEIEFKPQDENWEVTNIEDAINNIKYIEDHKCIKKDYLGYIDSYASTNNCQNGCPVTSTYDVTNKANYQDFTEDNFSIELDNAYAFSCGGGMQVTEKSVIKSYDSETGIFSTTIYGFGVNCLRSNANVKVYVSYLDYCD